MDEIEVVPRFVKFYRSRIGEILFLVRVYFGPGYRMYLGFDGDTVVVLLTGGNKSSQYEDIKKAKEYWENFKREKKYAHAKLR